MHACGDLGIFFTCTMGCDCVIDFTLRLVVTVCDWLWQTHTMEESSTNFAFMLGEMANNAHLSHCNFDAGRRPVRTTAIGRWMHE